MKTVTVTRKHWQGEKVEYSSKLGETLDEAMELHSEEELIYAYQQGAKAIFGTRLQAVCAESTGGDRSAPSMDLAEVQTWLAAGIPLTPVRVALSDSQKFAKYLMSLSPEEREAKVKEVQAMMPTE